MEKSKTYLTRAESAEFLTSQGFPVTKRQLDKLACLGGGPTYRRFGNKALSTPEELMAWAESRLSDPIENTAQK